MRSLHAHIHGHVRELSLVLCATEHVNTNANVSTHTYIHTYVRTYILFISKPAARNHQQQEPEPTSDLQEWRWAKQSPVRNLGVQDVSVKAFRVYGLGFNLGDPPNRKAYTVIHIPNPKSLFSPRPSCPEDFSSTTTMVSQPVLSLSGLPGF